MQRSHHPKIVTASDWTRLHVYARHVSRLLQSQASLRLFEQTEVVEVAMREASAQGLCSPRAPSTMFAAVLRHFGIEADQLACVREIACHIVGSQSHLRA